MSEQGRGRSGRGNDLHPHTVAVHAGRPARVPDAPLSVPPVLASTYVSGGPMNYGRDANPIWSSFEEALGALEGGHAVAFSSGMAAISALLDLLAPAARVLASDRDGYLGTRALLSKLHEQGRIVWVPVDTSDGAAVGAALAPGDLLWVETPSNPLIRIADLTALVALARDVGARVVVDNTFATPLLQRPLEMGADFVVHSATKLLAGHSDVVLGAAVAGRKHPAEALVERRTLGGAVPGPLETFLALRGLRTLGVRLERAQSNARVLAQRLAAHPAIRRVRYPGLEEDPGHALAAGRMKGFGSMLSFELADARAADAVCVATRVIVPATSLGGVETTIERRAKYARDSHMPGGLVRMSVGIEDVDDLWADLEAALVLSR